MYVVKIGGSLITDKNAYCKPEFENIYQYARIIKKNWTALKGNLIIVLGGGSYGNAVPKRYHIDNSMNHWKPENIAMMTIKMQEWMREFYYAFKKYDIPCYPFQASAFVVSNEGEHYSSYIDPIKKCLELGLLPIISGDLVFDEKNDFGIFSSDKIPEVIAEHLDVKKVVMLTDVPGVYFQNNKKEIIKTINKQNYRSVLGETGGSLKQDVTGGMKTKVKSLYKLSQYGCDSVICDGREPENIIEAFNEDKQIGTLIEGDNTNNIMRGDII
ncbi:isopentenyl phosphate kinase family protein [Bacillus sp. A301a_S52]|nr:isopentenyl phosphate kinase family protein [Bacillus sp. A301a_S52]